jgi:hypothetical protein
MPFLKPPQWCSSHPIRFVLPSHGLDGTQALTKLERDYQQFLRELREAVVCFGAARVKQDVQDIIKGRQGNTPDEERNTLLLAEYDLQAANGKVNVSKLARDFRKKHHLRTVKANSLRTQVTRLLETREWEIRKKAESDRMLRKPSVAGSATK